MPNTLNTDTLDNVWFGWWHSQLELYNIPIASLQKGKIPPTSVLDMALNNLMMRLQ